jgi:hypothetical protein
MEVVAGVGIRVAIPVRRHHRGASSNYWRSGTWNRKPLNNYKRRLKMKRIMIGALALVLTIGFIGASLAAEKGNERKGKYTYRKVYKACHERGAVESVRPLLSPDTKTQAQWDRVFESKEFDQFNCQQEWSALSPEDLNDIHAYLHDHAADSPAPAKCK